VSRESARNLDHGTEFGKKGALVALTKDLWSKLQAASTNSSEPTATKPGKDDSHKTKLKAKGRAPFTPFTRT
jgi:hypothetical protein